MNLHCSNLIVAPFILRPRAGVTRAGVDSVREQDKPEAGKCLKTVQNPAGQMHPLFGGDLYVTVMFHG